MVSGLGKTYNPQAAGGPARGAPAGEDGVRVHSLRSPGVLETQEIVFGAPGERLVIRAEAGDGRAVARGVVLAIRKVAGLKSFVVGLDKLL